MHEWREVCGRRSMVIAMAALALLILVLLLLPSGGPAGAQSVIGSVPLEDPECLAVNPLTNRVYVATGAGVTVLDGQSSAVLQEIPIAGGADAVAVNAQTNRLYVAGGDARDVLVMDAATGTQVGVIDELIGECSEIAIDPVRNRIWLADRSALVGVPDRVAVYDGATNTRLARVELGLSDKFERVRVAADPVLNRVYASYSGDDTLALIDGGSFAKLAQVAVGGGVDTVAAHTGRVRAYVETTAGIVAVDGTTFGQTGLIGHKGNVAVNAASDRIYIGGSRKLYIADGATHAVSASFDLPSLNLYPAANERTGRVFVVHRYDDLVSVVQDIAPPPPTETPSPTVTPSLAPATATPTATPSSTATDTRTPAATPSPTAAPSRTATPSPTATPSRTATAAVVPTATPTRTSIPAERHSLFLPLLVVRGTSAPTATATATPTPTRTAATPSPTATASDITTAEVMGAHCLTVNPVANEVYVAMETGVTVLDGQTLAVLRQLPIDRGAKAVAINPQSSRLYVAGTDAQRVLVLDLSTGVQMGVIDERIYDCSEIAVDAVRNRIWLEDRSVVVGVPDRAVVYDGSTNTRLASIDLGLTAYVEKVRVAVDPVLNRGYAAYGGDDTLAVIDGGNFSKLAQVAVGGAVDTVAAHAGRGWAYVETSAGVVVVDGTTYAQLGLIGKSGNVAVNGASDRIYIGRSSKLYIAGASTLALVATVDLPASNPYPEVNEQTGRVYSVHRYYDLVSMVQDPTI